MQSSTKRQQALIRHIRRVKRRIKALEARKNSVSRFRPFVFFAGVALTFWLGWTPLIIAIALISVDMFVCSRIDKNILRHRLWNEIKTTQLARMNLDWEQIPEPEFQPSDDAHSFEIDLDITGSKSLHHLIDMTISREGSHRLRQWLLQTFPDPERISQRQEIIRELVSLSRFRDKLLLHFRLVSKDQLDGQKLLRWLQGQSPSEMFRLALPLASSLSALNITLFLGYHFGWIPGYWVLSFALYVGVNLWYQSALKRSFDNVMLLYDELDKFKTILRYLETYPYGKNTHLKGLCEPFTSKETLPSVRLRTVTLLVTAVGPRVNPVLALLLNAVIPWDIVVGFFIDRCKAQCLRLFPQWVEAWSELEALVSLANFAYLHPEYVFPDMLSADEHPETALFEANDMGHPLIPSDQKVCNDFSLQRMGEITLITGSNMAGKSTFLKTIGVNLCLAYTGGPVNAARFSTRLFRLFTCMQIHDSITGGLSLFYAEVKRLQTLLTLLHDDDSLPVLFLIDEIFKGTNSRERLIGSRAYIHHLSTQPGIGLIATHDLELGQLERQIATLQNYHFRDEVAEGKMIFDYKLHPGLCTTTNALKIMQMEGLPVESHPYRTGG